MKHDEHFRLLRGPAYGLYHLDTLEESASGRYLYDIVPTFFSKYDAAHQKRLLDALAWAINNDSLDWEDILPHLPHSDDFKREHLRITRDRLLKQKMDENCA